MATSIRSAPVCGRVSWNARIFPLGCHEAADCGILAVGQSLRVSGAVGSLPIEILLHIPVRPEHDSAPVRCPHRLLILCRVQGELGCSVVLPLVHPDGELLPVVDLDGEARAVWRELRVAPIRRRRAERRPSSRSIDPLNRRATHGRRANRAVQIDKRAGLRRGELRRAAIRVRSHTVQREKRGTRHFEPLEIERHSKDLGVVQIDDMAAGKISPVGAAALDDFALAGGQRLHDERRIVPVHAAGVTPKRAARGRPARPAATHVRLRRRREW